MVVAAIDPSIVSTGHAVLQDGKLVAYGHGPLRSHEQINHLVGVLASHQPDLVLIEAGYLGANAKTGLRLAELRGALTHALRSRGFTVEQVLPSAWRKSTLKPPARSKRASLKAMSIAFVLQRFGIEVRDDVADAVCIGLYGLGAK